MTEAAAANSNRGGEREADVTEEVALVDGDPRVEQAGSDRVAEVS